MANITADTYLDDGTARTAGETHAISNGARLTIRTDTRVHANAPASFTGSLGSPTFTGIGGELYIDATAVRWLAFNSGSGNVPAIGTSIVQGSVSGYLLGVWASLSSAPTAVGAAMPTSGFIKLREVTSGPYTTGALTGIGASATAADVTGWIELVFDAATNFVVGRVGKWTSRGDWFYLDDTNGSIGQTIQIPSSGAVTNNYSPGVFVETAPGSGQYEFWTGLASAANGWSRQNLGYAEGYGDKRCKFVKAFGSGVIQFGETETLAATYASLAAQASTYVANSVTATYTWADDVLTVVCTGGHYLDTGMQTGLDFTSGGGVDGIFTVTVIDAYTFTVPYVGSVASGNVTVRPGLTVSFTSHGLYQGEQVYCDFTSGGGVDGTYTIYSIDATGTYRISYPHTTAPASGNVSVLHSLVVTYTAHGHVAGQEVYCDFTTGTGADGRYIIRTVPDANTFRVNFPHSATTSGNVTLRWTIGSVPESGCKVRIPNIMMAECATGSRATNSVPNATIASRPEFTTTAAGAIDLEHFYVWSMRSIFDQAYSVRLHHCAFSETLQVTECATAEDINDIGVGMYSAQDARALQLSSNFAGGTVSNVWAQRATVGTTDHAAELAYCRGTTITNLVSGIIGYGRSTGLPFNMTTCQNVTVNGVRVFNGNIYMTTCTNVVVTDVDYNDRYIGRTNATTPYYGVYVSACVGVTVDGYTCGLGNTLDDCHPYSGLAVVYYSQNIRLRNFGSAASYIPTGVWAPSAFATGYLVALQGNNSNVKVQRVFGGKVRTAYVILTNSDKGLVLEQVLAKHPWAHASKTIMSMGVTNLNAEMRGFTHPLESTSGQTSVYGTHFTSNFRGGMFGAIALHMNEPTAETADYVTVVSGTPKFDSAGGCILPVVGDEVIWEMPFFAKGHTGFQNTAPLMSGGTIGNYTITYQIDLGSGWNGSWQTLNGTNLSAHTVDPAVGFKLKVKIVTATASTAAITYVRIFTTTTWAAQESSTYPLDVVTVAATVLDAADGSPIEDARVLLRASSGATVTITRSSSTATVSHTAHGYASGQKVVISGAAQGEYNGLKTITVTGADAYTFTVSGTPTTPATGTITSYRCVLDAETNASGVAQDTNVELTGATLAVVGSARKAASAPYYKPSPLSGTITSAGLAVTSYLVGDA